ncbi:hypothetical protein BDW59DRAFT_154855 [Aspergillus cavernicola]|uniref:Uncharacterized protein n=1 Tax=Aspergillus cavernicola TaxID=176166 RepID=A0ABR4HD52_9EURO
MELPGNEKYKAASNSRNENPWLNNLGLSEHDLIDLRNVQTTYHVQLNDHPDVGYHFRMWLLWDYDRIWGVFDMGYTKGLFLVDPGPKPSAIHKSPFSWRGVEKSATDTVLCNELITKGEIVIEPGNLEIEGTFEFMAGNGEPGGEQCAFRGKPHFGPSVVPYSLEGVVDEWNDYGFLEEEERVRQYLSLEELAADLRRRDERRAASGF